MCGVPCRHLVQVHVCLLRLRNSRPCLISFVQTNEDDLRYKFERYGKLMDVYIPREPGSNRPRGFGFVTYHDRRDAEDGCAEMDGCDLLPHCNVFFTSLTCFFQTTDASCRAV